MDRIFRLLIIIALAVSAGYAENWENYDLAPGAIPGQNSGGTDPWYLIYAWEDMEAQTGDNGMLGIAFDGEFVWVSGRGVTANNMFYLFDPETGDMMDSFPTGTTSSWGVRDMCFDGIYIYGGQEGGLTCWDITAHYQVSTIPIPTGMAFQRANAYDPATDHFYCGSFGQQCYEQDRQGNLIRSWYPGPLTSIYGMAWDDDAPDGPWLWIHDQTNPVNGCNIHQMDPVTLQYTGYVETVSVPPSNEQMAGGLDYSPLLHPLYTTMLVFNQGTPDAGAAYEMYTCPQYYNITLSPYGTPIVIPANGGQFEYNLTLQYSGLFPTTPDIWVNATLPDGSQTRPLINVNVTMQPGIPISRDRVQAVPEVAPPGEYDYAAYIGVYPSVIWEEDHFEFEKLAAGDGEIVEDWYCWGEAFPGEVIESISELPDEFALSTPYPNPFNNQTTVRYSLPEACKIRLAVYDVTGREVESLVTGHLSPGVYEAVWDASGVASGVYFVRLTVDGGRLMDVKKVMLVK